MVIKRSSTKKVRGPVTAEMRPAVEDKAAKALQTPTHDFWEGEKYLVVDFDELRQLVIDQQQGTTAEGDLFAVTTEMCARLRNAASVRQIHLIMHRPIGAVLRGNLIPHGVMYAVAKVTCVYPNGNLHVIKRGRDEIDRLP